MRTTRAVLFDFGGVLAEEGFSNGLEALGRDFVRAARALAGAQARRQRVHGVAGGAGPDQQHGKQGREDTHPNPRHFIFLQHPWVYEFSQGTGGDVFEGSRK